MKKNLKFIIAILFINIFIILMIINFKLSLFYIIPLIILSTMNIYLTSFLVSNLTIILHSNFLTNIISLNSKKYDKDYIDNIYKVEQNMFVSIFTLLYLPLHIMIFFIYSILNNSYLYLLLILGLSVIMFIFIKKYQNDFKSKNYFKGINHFLIAGTEDKEYQSIKNKFKTYLKKEKKMLLIIVIYLLLIILLIKNIFLGLFTIPLLLGLLNTKNYLKTYNYYKEYKIVDEDKRNKEIKSFTKDITLQNIKVRNFTNFNITFPKSKICIIYGPNLSGKSTILDVLANRITLEDGNILVDNQRLINNKLDISYMRYNDYLFSNTIKNMFIELNPKTNDTRIHFWLREVNAEYFTYDLQKLILDNGSNLTEEEQCKLKMALNLVKDNNILLFDEPFKYFDFNTIKRITANLRYLPNTIIITTSDYNHLRFADVAYIIDNNSLLYSGDFKDIPDNLERKYKI